MVSMNAHGSPSLSMSELACIIEEKARVRQAMRDIRYVMPFDDWIGKTAAIASKAMNMPEFKDARRVCCYLHKESTREAGTGQIINRVLGDGTKELVVPITRVDRFDLDLSIVRSRDELVIGAFNVLEPIPIKEELVAVDTCDLLIVPCLAVDVKGNRLGYGKGYYDKLLSKVTRDIPVVALAFDFQVLHHVPALAHDKAVDAIVTELRSVHCEP